MFKWFTTDKAVSQYVVILPHVASPLLSCSYLDDIGKSGEYAAEFLALFKRLIAPVHWKYYLALRGILLHLGDLITQVSLWPVGEITDDILFSGTSKTDHCFLKSLTYRRCYVKWPDLHCWLDSENCIDLRKVVWGLSGG